MSFSMFRGGLSPDLAASLRRMGLGDAERLGTMVGMEDGEMEEWWAELLPRAPAAGELRASRVFWRPLLW